jgi:hypothetical protein
MPDLESAEMTPLLYISYDLPKVQQFAARLQMAGAAAGIKSYIPVIDSRHRDIDEETADRIWKADAVIVFLSAQRSAGTRAVDQEIEHARKAGTALTVISITHQDRDADLPWEFEKSIFAMILVGFGLAALAKPESC